MCKRPFCKTNREGFLVLGDWSHDRGEMAHNHDYKCTTGPQDGKRPHNLDSTYTIRMSREKLEESWERLGIHAKFVSTQED